MDMNLTKLKEMMSMGSQKPRHDLATEQQQMYPSFLFFFLQLLNICVCVCMCVCVCVCVCVYV